MTLALAVSAQAYAAEELHLYNWNNYLSESTAKNFEAYCKCKLVQDFYGDNEEMLAVGDRRQRLRHRGADRLRGGGADQAGQGAAAGQNSCPTSRT